MVRCHRLAMAQGNRRNFDEPFWDPQELRDVSNNNGCVFFFFHAAQTGVCARPLFRFKQFCSHGVTNSKRGARLLRIPPFWCLLKEHQTEHHHVGGPLLGPNKRHTQLKLFGTKWASPNEDREVIFTRLTPARGMYITAPGHETSSLLMFVCKRL